jgi:hypothetical protein
MTTVLFSGPSETRGSGRDRSSAPDLAFAVCGADLGVGDLVGEQGVDLGGLDGGVAEAAWDQADKQLLRDHLRRAARQGIRCHGPSFDIDGDTSLMISESGHDLTPAHHVRPVMT